MSKTRMTVGQAIVKFLNQQYIEMDGKEEPFVDGMFTIFGHGMVVGLGQALEEDPGHLRVYQGRNEQGMAHAAISYAKQHNRRKIIACTSSIGVGAANMVTAALTATINNIRLLRNPSAGSGSPAARGSERPVHVRFGLLQAGCQVLGPHFSSGAADERDGQRNARPDRHRKLRHRCYLAPAGCTG